MKSVELYAQVRFAVQIEGVSRRVLLDCSVYHRGIDAAATFGLQEK
jgi:hypothetical protein